MLLNSLQRKPIHHGDRPSLAWLNVAVWQLFSLATVAAFLIPFEGSERISLRLFLRAAGICSAAVSVARTREVQYFDKYWRFREVMREDRFLEAQATTPMTIDVTSDELEPQYLGLPRFDRTAFLASVTGVAILGNSGAGKTTLAQYIAAAEPAQILVLDPHADRDDEHYPWGELTVISDKDEILAQLGKLLELLDKKDKTPLTVICDEYPAIRLHAIRNKSTVADDFIIRYGSEARKFKKLPIFISQSGNVKALGLEGMGDFLENFALVRLQKIAVKYLKTSPERDLYELAKNTAYSMLIGEDNIVHHPTHGCYSQVQKYLPPQNLSPLVSLPLTIPLVRKSSHTPAPPTTPRPKGSHTVRESLEALLDIDFQRPATPQPPQPPQPNTPDMGVSCPECGSNNLKRNGSYARDRSKSRYQCKDCGKNWID